MEGDGEEEGQVSVPLRTYSHTGCDNSGCVRVMKTTLIPSSDEAASSHLLLGGGVRHGDGVRVQGDILHSEGLGCAVLDVSNYGVA